LANIEMARMRPNASKNPGLKDAPPSLAADPWYRGGAFAWAIGPIGRFIRPLRPRRPRGPCCDGKCWL